MRKLARERLAQVFRVTARLVWGNGSLKLAELFNQTEVAQLFVCLAHLFYVLGERIHQIFLHVETLLGQGMRHQPKQIVAERRDVRRLWRVG